MVLEIARIRVREGAEDGFVDAFWEAVAQVQGSPGCRSTRLTRGIENPQTFVLLVEWDRLEDHTEGFRGSDRFTRWRELLGPFFAAPPEVEHAQDVTG